jgi:hypothetical protein
VSFLVVSGVIFFAVSTTGVLVVSHTLVVSEVLVDFEPLQAAKEKAMNKARLNLLMVFIVVMN